MLYTRKDLEYLSMRKGVFGIGEYGYYPRLIGGCIDTSPFYTRSYMCVHVCVCMFVQVELGKRYR